MTSMENEAKSDEIIPLSNGQGSVTKKNCTIFKKFLKSIPALLFVGYFIWATYYQLAESTSTVHQSSCDGYGFLLIITCLTAFVIAFNLTFPYIYGVITSISKGPVQKFQENEIVSKYGAYTLYAVILAGFLAFLIYDTRDNYNRMIPLAGLCIYIAVAVLLSSNRKKIPVRTIFCGFIFQLIFGLLTIRWEVGRNIFQCFGNKVQKFLEYGVDGAAFVYGDYLVNELHIFAFAALAAIYFLSFFINILYYYNIMQTFVLAIGRFFRICMGTSICESVYSATNVFLGQSESPFMIKPFLPDMTDAELLSIMTSGFATVAGSTLAAYMAFGANAGDLITATLMSCPTALALSKILHPETEELKVTPKKVKSLRMKFDSVLDAASKGAQEASAVVIGIISSLIAVLAFVYFVNGVLVWMGILVGFEQPDEQWKIETILGKIFMPISFVMGVPWDECEKVGKLVGIKTVINEFVAFEEMGKMNLTSTSKTIATFAICGFANPGSIGIVVSILSTLVPERKSAVTRLVFKAFLGGCMSSLMTACVAGMLTPPDLYNTTSYIF